MYQDGTYGNKKRYENQITLQMNRQYRFVNLRIALCRLMLGPQDAPEERLSQQGLADMLSKRLEPKEGRTGLSKMMISRWERGEISPSLEALAAIADVYGVDPAWLAFGDGNNRLSPLPSVIEGLGEDVERIYGAMRSLHSATNKVR